ncbi:MAG: hypothetical protein U0T84_11870 [Chitinophagales bacterium]
MSLVFSNRDVVDATVGVAGLGATALVSLSVIPNPVGWGVGAAVLLYGGTTLIYDIATKK